MTTPVIFIIALKANVERTICSEKREYMLIPPYPAGDPSALSSFRSVVDGFAWEWRHKCGGLAQLARLLIGVGEADDLLFLVWFAKERDRHRQALGSDAHWNDDGRKAD